MSSHIAGVIRRYYNDLWSLGNLSAADDIFAADVALYGPEHPDGVRGLDAIKREVVATRKAFPDLRLMVDKQVIEGDRAMVRWTMLGTQAGEFRGLTPTDRIILLSGVDLLYVKEGKITMIWSYFDAMVAYQQRAGAVETARVSLKVAAR